MIMVILLILMLVAAYVFGRMAGNLVKMMSNSKRI